jgi:hypothetical protein
MPWKKLLVWATGQIDEALRQKLEFVLEENRVYRVPCEYSDAHRVCGFGPFSIPPHLQEKLQ